MPDYIILTISQSSFFWLHQIICLKMECYQLFYYICLRLYPIHNEGALRGLFYGFEYFELNLLFSIFGVLKQYFP